MALERAGGGRQDLTFDAAVPMFVNCPILARFLASLLLLWSCGYCICGLLPRPGLGQLSCDLLAMNMASSSPPELRLTSAIATRMRDGLGVVVGRPESCAPRHIGCCPGSREDRDTAMESRLTCQTTRMTETGDTRVSTEKR